MEYRIFFRSLFRAGRISSYFALIFKRKSTNIKDDVRNRHISIREIEKKERDGESAKYGHKSLDSDKYDH